MIISHCTTSEKLSFLISIVEVTGDNGFSLNINGDPQTFSPGATYTLRYVSTTFYGYEAVSKTCFRLRGDKDHTFQKQFQRFVLSSANDDQRR